MADISLHAASVLGGINLEFGDCALTEITDIALISVAIPQGGQDAVSEKLKEIWKLPIPGAVTTTNAGVMRAIPMSQDQFMLAFSPEPDLSETSAQSDLAEVAYTTLQTDAWVILELSGAGAVTALERICQIDLDLSSFPTGSAARTTMEHLGVCLVRIEDNRFWLMSARSSARSLLHAVETSCRWTTA